MVGPAGQKEPKELDGFGEQDVIAQAAGLMAERLGEMGFAHAGRTIEQDMLPFFDKGAVTQVANQPAIEFGVDGKVRLLRKGNIR